MSLDLWSQRAREAREALDVAPPDMAALLGVREEDVAAWEGGETPTPEVMGRYAVLLGLELRELLRQAVDRNNPTPLLFRYAKKEFDLASGFEVSRFLPLHAARPLGDFLRHARRLHRLEARLEWPTQQERLEQIPPTPLPHADAPDAYERAAKQGQDLAHEARRAWGLGDEPIASMSDFLEQGLGVPLFGLPPEALPKNIEAASARVPLAVVLLRDPGTSQEATRVRMTLAHELCHLLHDRDELGETATGAPFFSFTPSTQRADSTKPTASLWHRRFERLERIEARARSFAASFLAPLSGVKGLLGDQRPDTPQAIYRVREHFGVSREVAINQLCNAYWRPYSAEWRKAGRDMRGLPGSQPWSHPQEARRNTLLHPRLRAAIIAAAQDHKITLSEAWGYAGRRLDEPLASPAETQDPRLLRPLRPSAP